MYGQDILYGISEVPFEITHTLEDVFLLRSEDLRALSLTSS